MVSSRDRFYGIEGVFASVRVEICRKKPTQIMIWISAWVVVTGKFVERRIIISRSDPRLVTYVSINSAGQVANTVPLMTVGIPPR